MSISSFEAVCIYDGLKSKNTGVAINFPSLYLVINVDDYSAGLCLIEKNGHTRLIDCRNISSERRCIDDIEACFSDKCHSTTSFYNSITPYIDTFNKGMKEFYLSEKQMNQGFKDILNFDFCCSEFDEVFNVSNQKIKNLLLTSNEMFHEEKCNSDNCKIAIVGKMAKFYPIVFSVKETMSFDPFLADDRYVSDDYTDDVEKIIDIGRSEYERLLEKEREAFITIYKDKKCNRKKLIISDTIGDSSKIEFVGPIFISENEKIELIINSKSYNLDLPYSIKPLDCDLIEVAGYIRDEKITIRIRRYTQPTKVYDISLT